MERLAVPLVVNLKRNYVHTKYMPVSLNKIRKLQEKLLQVKTVEPSVYKRPKKNSPAYWQVSILGKIVSPVFKTKDEADFFIRKNALYEQLPSIDRIPINEYNRKRDSEITERS